MLTEPGRGWGGPCAGGAAASQQMELDPHPRTPLTRPRVPGLSLSFLVTDLFCGVHSLASSLLGGSLSGAQNEKEFLLLPRGHHGYPACGHVCVCVCVLYVHGYMCAPATCVHRHVCLCTCMFVCLYVCACVAVHVARVRVCVRACGQLVCTHMKVDALIRPAPALFTGVGAWDESRELCVGASGHLGFMQHRSVLPRPPLRASTPGSTHVTGRTAGGTSHAWGCRGLEEGAPTASAVGGPHMGGHRQPSTRAGRGTGSVREAGPACMRV